MSKRPFIAAAALSILAALAPFSVGAEEGVGSAQGSASVSFPDAITFELSAESDADIVDIRLHYQVERVDFADVTTEVYIEFDPAPSVEEGWMWDMRKTGGLPPGAVVRYWWTVEDVDGNVFGTEPISLEFADDRYNWRSLELGQVILYWYEADETFARDLGMGVEGALKRLADETGAEMERPVSIYVYSNSQDLQGALMFPQEWTGGVAHTRYGVIAIGIGPDELEWGRRAVSHELTHMVVHQVTLNPYGDIPVWLDEGLAVNNEGALDQVYSAALQLGIDGGTLMSLQSLASPFSTDPMKALLSYAQSQSVVDFLITEYGREDMLRLLNTFAEGSTYDAALEGVYGFDTDGLDALWSDWIYDSEYLPQ